MGEGPRRRHRWRNAPCQEVSIMTSPAEKPVLDAGGYLASEDWQAQKHEYVRGGSRAVSDAG